MGVSGRWQGVGTRCEEWRCGGGRPVRRAALGARSRWALDACTGRGRGIEESPVEPCVTSPA